MRLLRKEKDQPDVRGKVVVNIDVRRVDRQTRKVKIIVAAMWASKTLFKAEYSSAAKNDMQAVNEAQFIAENFCKHEDYIITSVETTGANLPVIKNIEKGSRW